MIKFNMLFLLVLLFSSITTKDILNLIPIPEKIEYKEGSFSFSEKTQVFLPKEYESNLKPYLFEKMKADLGVSIEILTEKNKKNSPSISFEKSQDNSKHHESYTYKITSKSWTLQ